MNDVAGMDAHDPSRSAAIRSSIHHTDPHGGLITKGKFGEHTSHRRSSENSVHATSLDVTAGTHTAGISGIYAPGSTLSQKYYI